MNILIVYLLFIACIFTSSCSQLLLKKGALKQYSGIKVYLNKEVIIGYCIFFLVTIFSTYLYKYIDLSIGTLLDSLGYIFVTALSLLFLKEKLTFKKTIGIILIASGVCICILFKP